MCEHEVLCYYCQRYVDCEEATLVGEDDDGEIWWCGCDEFAGEETDNDQQL